MRLVGICYLRLRGLLASSKSNSEPKVMVDDFQEPGNKWAINWEQSLGYALPSESDDDATCVENDGLAIPTAKGIAYADSESLRSEVGDISITEPPAPQKSRSKASSVVTLCHKIVFRVVMLAVAYYLTCSGVVTYLGYAQSNMFLSVIGHAVPGSIVLLWGILGFLRFTGTFVEGGWAWSPSGCRYHRLSLEMAGCIVLVSYGVLALEEEIRVYDASDPRQMQHLALSACLAFTAAICVLLESDLVKRLGASVKAPTTENPRQYATNPSSSIAFCIAGLLMLGHPQRYKFALSMHKHWGTGFILASVFRFMTCALSWMGSQDPQRAGATHYPPTEFLASFTYTTSSLMLMFSVNEVSYDAMRLGFDDAAIFRCVTAATTALIFFWILVLKIIGAWALGAGRRVCTL